MGGCGSGRWGWYTRKRTVEETGIIDIDALVCAGLTGHRRGVIEWTNPTSDVRNRLGFRLTATDHPTSLVLDLFYTLSSPRQSEERVQRIPLISKPQPFGGQRLYFSCPTLCGRHVRKLYSVPGRGFACRSCQNLTYASSQQHDSRCDVWRRNPQALRAAVEAHSLLAMGYFLACHRRQERKLLALHGVTITPIPWGEEPSQKSVAR
jgi:hypothetical protein